MEATLRETVTFRSGPDGRNKQLWSGSGGGLQGRGPLSAAGRGLPRRLETLCRPFSSERVTVAPTRIKLTNQRFYAEQMMLITAWRFSTVTALRPRSSAGSTPFGSVTFSP
jgi:hypothetical protein